MLSQFAFTTPPVRPSQEDFRSTKSHEEGDASSTETGKPLPTPRRTFTFEAPMRPLDVAGNMYLDYSAVQSIKFYNKVATKSKQNSNKIKTKNATKTQQNSNEIKILVKQDHDFVAFLF